MDKKQLDTRTTTHTHNLEQAPGSVRIVGEGLRKLLGGAKLSREEELTRDVLII